MVQNALNDISVNISDLRLERVKDILAVFGLEYKNERQVVDDLFDLGFRLSFEEPKIVKGEDYTFSVELTWVAKLVSVYYKLKMFKIGEKVYDDNGKVFTVVGYNYKVEDKNGKRFNYKERDLNVIKK